MAYADPKVPNNQCSFSVLNVGNDPESEGFIEGFSTYRYFDNGVEQLISQISTDSEPPITFFLAKTQRPTAIDKSQITDVHRRVATGLLGFMSMFYIKIVKEMIEMEFNGVLNYNVCQPLVFSREAMVAEDDQLFDPLRK